MTYIHDDDMNEYKCYSAKEAAWDLMNIEVSQLAQPVHFRSHGTCTLIECVRDGKPVFGDGKPVFQGDLCLSEVPF